MEKKKINFIERNKQMLNKSENQRRKVSDTRAESARVTSSENKAAREATNNANVKSSVKPSRPPLTVKNTSVRPKSAPSKTASVKTSVKPSKSSSSSGKSSVVASREKDYDIITKLMRRNLQGVLQNIFIPQDNITLQSCREVSRSWLRCIRMLWRQRPFLQVMSARLAENWLHKRYERVMLKIVSGVACKKKCAENFRDCHCGDSVMCQVIGNSLYLDFGGRTFVGRYKVDDSEETVTVPFNIEQDQLKFNLKTGLELETKDWLSSPETIQMIMKTKITYQDYIIEKSPGDKNTILIKSLKTKEILAKQLMFQQQPLNSPIKDGIIGLDACSGRLAVNIGGRIYVHMIEKMLRGQTRFETEINIPGLGCDLDKYPNIEKHHVYYFYLGPNFLLLVFKNTVILYNFWKYLSRTNQTKQDFIV